MIIYNIYCAYPTIETPMILIIKNINISCYTLDKQNRLELNSYNNNIISNNNTNYQIQNNKLLSDSIIADYQDFTIFKDNLNIKILEINTSHNVLKYQIDDNINTQYEDIKLLKDNIKSQRIDINYLKDMNTKLYFELRSKNNTIINYFKISLFIFIVIYII